MLMGVDKEPKKKIKSFDMMFVEEKWLMTLEIFVYYTQDD